MTITRLSQTAGRRTTTLGLLLAAATVLGACGLSKTDEQPGIARATRADEAAAEVEVAGEDGDQAASPAVSDGGEKADADEPTDGQTDDKTNGQAGNQSSVGDDPVETVLASGEGSLEGLRLDILELRATATGTVLKYRIVNQGEADHFGMENKFTEELDYDHPEQPTGVRLVDETNGIVYEPARDEDDNCVCSIIVRVPPDQQSSFSITFGEADQNASLAVEFPTFGRFDGLRVGEAGSTDDSAPRPDGVLGTVTGSVPGHRIEVLELRATPSGPVMRYRIVNDGENEKFGLGNELADALDYDHPGQPTGVRLIDETSGVTYRPARDESDDCVCTLIDSIPPGQVGNYAITFGRGATPTATYSVEFPGFGSIDGLAVSTGQPIASSGRGEVESHMVDVLAVRQGPGGAVVDFEIVNAGEDKDFGLENEFNDALGYDHPGQPTGIRLIDEEGGIIYRPLLDQNGDCLCGAVNTIDEGQTLSVSVNFGAVEPSLALSVDIPGFGRYTGFSLDDAESVSTSIGAATRAEEYGGEGQAIIGKAISIRAEGKNITIDVAGDVLFEFDKATLTPAAKEILDQLEAELERAAGPVAVVGHTDSAGTNAYNQDLSERRADTVAAELRNRQSLSDLTFETDGAGEAEPIADNESDEGRAKNRRVTLTFTTS